MRSINKTIIFIALLGSCLCERFYDKERKHLPLDNERINYSMLRQSLKADRAVRQNSINSFGEFTDTPIKKNNWGGCKDCVPPVCWIRPPLDLVPGNPQWYDCCWTCNRGMTMKLIHHDDCGYLDYVRCNGTGCNWDIGDTPCYLPLPILCVNKHNLPNPGYTEINGCCRWLGGDMRLTEPIQGCVLQSKEHADSICAARFGCGWEMADYHTVDYDGITGHGNIGVTPWVINYFSWNLYERFWVSHAHDNANCWNSPNSV